MTLVQETKQELSVEINQLKNYHQDILELRENTTKLNVDFSRIQEQLEVAKIQLQTRKKEIDEGVKKHLTLETDLTNLKL